MMDENLKPGQGYNNRACYDRIKSNDIIQHYQPKNHIFNIIQLFVSIFHEMNLINHKLCEQDILKKKKKKKFSKYSYCLQYLTIKWRCLQKSLQKF